MPAVNKQANANAAAKAFIAGKPYENVRLDVIVADNERRLVSTGKTLAVMQYDRSLQETRVMTFFAGSTDTYDMLLRMNTLLIALHEHKILRYQTQYLMLGHDPHIVVKYFHDKHAPPQPVAYDQWWRHALVNESI